jgi:HD-GYP domain-containing protein (c-di-GMP phosphodiesterase class II)
MIKKIPISELQQGMFIHDLNCSWVEHPFLYNHFKIKSPEQISKVQATGVREIYIDTIKGIDAPGSTPQQEVNMKLDQELGKVVKLNSRPKSSVTVAEELIQAEGIRFEAQKTIKDILIDARLGRQVNVEKANKVVSSLAASVLRNKDALLSLDLIRHRDHYTFEHSVSVAVLLIAFGNEMGLSADDIHKLGIGGLLHDIGKTKIPDNVLNKPGPLTEKEFATMQKHAAYSGCILDGYNDIDEESVKLACQHHERMDGSGYPDKLLGGEISLFGQMAAIADVYDAIVSDRCYHQGQPPASVLKKMLEWSKHHFNEKLVHRFIHTVGIYPVGTLVGLENGHIAVVLEQGENGLLHPVLRCIYDGKKRAYIRPYVLDLSKPQSDTTSHRIVSYENPQKWGLRPFRYLNAS